MPTLSDLQGRVRKHRRTRKKVSGTSTRPRLCAYRSNEHMYGQIIDDDLGVTLVSSSTLLLDLKGKGMEVASKVGEHLGKIAIEKGISAVVFDRAGFKYHGRIKAFAEAARKAGLQF